MKFLSLIVFALLGSVLLGWADDAPVSPGLGEGRNLPSAASLVPCLRTVTGLETAWHPDNGAAVCAKKNRTCYLAYEDGSVYHFPLPSRPSFSIKRVEIELQSEPDLFENYLVFLNDPKTSKTVHLNPVLGENTGGFVRQVHRVNPNIFLDVLIRKTKDQNLEFFIENIALKNIEMNLDIVSKNLSQKTYPPGWTAQRYAEHALRRVSGCKRLDKKAEVIEQQAKSILTQNASMVKSR